MSMIEPAVQKRRFRPCRAAAASGLRVVVLALLTVQALPASAAKARCPAAGTQDAVVAAIVDGQTLRLSDGTVVRLAGVEVPASAGVLASAVIRDIVAPGATVSLSPAGEGADRYNRRHDFVFLAGNRMLQAALVAGGAARARWLPGEQACFAALLSAETAARRAGLGLWADGDAILAADDPSLVRRSGLYEIVAGQLFSVGRGTQVTFLDFGRNSGSDFTVMLSAAVVRDLTAAAGSVDSLVGRRLQVRGVIENNRGAAMRLNDAAEIELIGDPAKP